MDWTYGYSEALGMKYAYRMIGDKIEVMTEDKFIYKDSEIRALHKMGGITPAIHAVKRCFRGEVLDD